MNLRLTVSVTVGCALVLCAGMAGAQQAPSSPPQPEVMMQAGPEGDFVPPPFGEGMDPRGLPREAWFRAQESNLCFWIQRPASCQLDDPGLSES